MANADVIDDSFIGLVTPIRVVAEGRLELVSNRPGDILMEATAEFSRAGGFERSDAPDVTVAAEETAQDTIEFLHQTDDLDLSNYQRISQSF